MLWLTRKMFSAYEPTLPADTSGVATILIPLLQTKDNGKVSRLA